VNCPKCKNRNFEKNDANRRGIRQYKTERFPHGDYRRYVCVQCGYRFITMEKFDREPDSTASGKVRQRTH